jgi:hypothetical protein
MFSSGMAHPEATNYFRIANHPAEFVEADF